jgi:hypothetical protein
MLRWTPLLALALAACQPKDDADDTDVVDTDLADTDVADTDVADTDAQDTDVTDTDDTDVVDTDVADTDVPVFVALEFSVDDRANQTYTVADGLAWKGSLAFDAVTGLAAFDPSWVGPYPMLYDDGPVALGGHEPHDAVADDHVWGVSVQLPSPATELGFEYGAVRGSVSGQDGVWIWVGPNGAFTVPAHATGYITAPGLVLPAFGEVDLKLTIDVSHNGAQLAPDFQGVAYSSVAVKGNAWAWAEVVMTDDGTGADAVANDGVYTFLLSSAVGPHEGLLFVGDMTQFVFVLDGAEYRSGGQSSTAGVLAASDSVTPGVWTDEAIQIDVSTGNSEVAVGL